MNDDDQRKREEAAAQLRSLTKEQLDALRKWAADTLAAPPKNA